MAYDLKLYAADCENSKYQNSGKEIRMADVFSEV